ncbi:MAG: histidine phosphatase family protein [Austwickia sp.]|nr:histidine phosphatase family protein [Austwickia sp.]MCO5310952.1 histidine phosphatase family protein [Austwickia sp.]
MRLLLIRHGESANNAAYAATGLRTGRVAEPELTAVGHRQAAALGEALAGGAVGPVEVLLTSPMLRAVQTAGYLARALSRPVTVCPQAYESGGVYDLDHDSGVRTAAPCASFAQLRAHCPDLHFPPGLADPWWSGPHETPPQRLPRARRVLAELRERYAATPGLVALVAHQHFAQHVIAAALGLPALPALFFTQGNTATTLLDLRDAAHPVLRWSNGLEHLHPDLRTGC